jgi:hypothetical protein
MLEICLRIAGVLLILLAAAHVKFPRRFHWSEELPRLSRLNHQMFLVHVWYIVFLLASMGILSLVFTEALLTRTLLARLVLAFLCVFWATRLVVQWFVYDRQLWVGNRLNTGIHILFTAMWCYLSLVYGWALWRQLS